MPEVGEKFKTRSLPGHTLAFYQEGSNPDGSIVWWDFFDTKDGKRRSYYPDEVYPAGQKPPAGSAKNSNPSGIYIDPDAEPFEIVVDGITLRVV